MKKIVVITVGVLLLFLVGIFSFMISTDSLFFTTKYYDSPLLAYNDSAAYSAVSGNKKAKTEIGTSRIDKTKALFIGELGQDSFIIAEMNMKDEKYAFEGTSYVFEYSVNNNNSQYDKTKTDTGYIMWTIVYSKKDIEALTDIKSYNEYAMSNGSPIYLVVFNK